MKNNIIIAIASGICLLATTSMQAQNYSEKEMALAYNNMPKKATTTVAKEVSITETAGIVDYPTISYPETSGFAVEKEKAFYHLSWQVAMRDGLSYTEIQSSTDGVNFTTVGFVMNDVMLKGNNFDYFVPSDKNGTTSFRLVQHGMNTQKHISEILRVK